MTIQHVVEGASAPTAPPPSLSAHYINTATGEQYLAKGTASVADWVLQEKGMSKAEADAAYQPKGSYQAAGDYVTATEAAEAYQPKGSYQPAGEYLTPAAADEAYQPKGSYQAAGDYATSQQLADGLSAKVDAVAGMGLSSNDFTTEEKTKLAGLSADAGTGGTATAAEPAPGDVLLSAKNPGTDYVSLKTAASVSAADYPELYGMLTKWKALTGKAVGYNSTLTAGATVREFWAGAGPSGSAYQNGWIGRTPDFGETWTFSRPVTSRIRRIIVDSTGGSVIALGLNPVECTDGEGTTWTPITIADPAVEILGGYTSAWNDSIVYAGTKLWKRAANTTAWTALPDQPRTVQGIAGNGNVWIAVTNGLPRISQDGGTTWSDATVGSAGVAIAVDESGNWVYGGSGYIWNSRDDGVTWARTPATDADGYTRNVVRVTTDRNGRWLAISDAADRTYFESTDNGRSWRRDTLDGTSPLLDVAMSPYGYTYMMMEKGDHPLFHTFESDVGTKTPTYATPFPIVAYMRAAGEKKEATYGPFKITLSVGNVASGDWATEGYNGTYATPTFVEHLPRVVNSFIGNMGVGGEALTLYMTFDTGIKGLTSARLVFADGSEATLPANAFGFEGSLPEALRPAANTDFTFDLYLNTDTR